MAQLFRISNDMEMEVIGRSRLEIGLNSVVPEYMPRDISMLAAICTVFRPDGSVLATLRKHRSGKALDVKLAGMKEALKSDVFELRTEGERDPILVATNRESGGMKVDLNRRPIILAAYTDILEEGFPQNRTENL